MRKTQQVFGFSAREELRCEIPASELKRYLRGWQLEGEIRNLTTRTLDTRAMYVRLLLWFVEDRELETFGPDEVRQLLVHVRSGHEEPGGRWGKSFKPARPRYIEHWFDQLQAFENYLLAEHAISTPLLRQRDKPVVPEEDIVPFTPEQIEALLAAARKSNHSRRDEALLLFLLDNGVRASELCGIRLEHVDFQEFSCRVLGKGRKQRTVPFGIRTKKALWRYIHEGPERPLASPLFLSDRGTTAGEALTTSGLFQLIRRLGRAAKIQGVRCSPHTFRHTFAIEWLRNDGAELALMKILGHTSLTMTQRYTKLANADVLKKHRIHSPVDRMLGRNPL